MTPSNLLDYAIGLCLEGFGIYLALHPKKLGRIGFGRPGGAVPKEIPPLPRWLALFLAAELLCFCTGILAWNALGHSAQAFLTIAGAFSFLVTMGLISLVAGFSARQHSGFTAKTASQVRSYRISAFVFAGIAIGMLLVIFALPLVHYR